MYRDLWLKIDQTNAILGPDCTRSAPSVNIWGHGTVCSQAWMKFCSSNSSDFFEGLFLSKLKDLDAHDLFSNH